MPSSMSFIIIYGMVFIFAVYIGFLVGQLICKRSVITTREYWLWNLGGIFAAVLVAAFTTAPMLHVGIIGALAGYIVGLKMTFGESSGPWKFLDRFLNVNPGHRKVAREGTGEERRRRRKTGEKAPDLISVDSGKKENSR